MRCHVNCAGLIAILLGLIAAGVASAQEKPGEPASQKSDPAETVAAPKPAQPNADSPAPNETPPPTEETPLSESKPAPLPPMITAHQTTRLTFQAQQLRLDAELDYSIEQGPAHQLVLTVPEDIAIARVAADAVREFRVDPDHARLVIDLNQPMQGALRLQISGTMPLESGGFDETQLLPLLAPENVASETGTILIYTPAGVKVIADDEVIGAQPAEADPAEQHLGARLASAWSYQERPVEVSVRTRRQTPRIAARVMTTLDVALDHVAVSTQMHFQVDRSTPDILRFAVPEAVAEQLWLSQDPHATRLNLDQAYRDESAVEGWVAWNIRLPHLSTANYALKLNYRIPLSLQNGQSQTLTIPISRPLPARNAHQTDVPVESVSGEILITRQDDLSLSAETTGNGVHPVALDAISLRSDRGKLAYRYAAAAVEIKLTAVPSAFPPGVKTAVSSATVDVVIDNGMQMSWRGTFRLTTRERQRLRIDVPQGAQVLRGLIDGKQTALRKRDGFTSEDGWETYDVDVVRAGPLSEPLTLTIIFVSQTPLRTFAARGGSMLLRLPRVGGDEKDAVTQHTDVNTWIPSGFVLVSRPNDYAKTHGHRIGELFECGAVDASSRAGDGDFPASGRVYRYTRIGGPVPLEITWWDMSFYTWITSGALVLIAITVVNTSRRNKLAIVAALAFLLAAYSFFSPERGWHILLAARIGIIGMPVVWLIRAGIDCCASAPTGRRTLVPITVPPPGPAALRSTSPAAKSDAPTFPTEGSEPPRPA